MSLHLAPLPYSFALAEPVVFKFDVWLGTQLQTSTTQRWDGFTRVHVLFHISGSDEPMVFRFDVCTCHVSCA